MRSMATDTIWAASSYRAHHSCGSALASGTAQLPDEAGEAPRFPASTVEAIATGAFDAPRGCRRTLSPARFRTMGVAPLVIGTGGHWRQSRPPSVSGRNPRQSDFRRPSRNRRRHSRIPESMARFVFFFCCSCQRGNRGVGLSASRRASTTATLEVNAAAFKIV